MLRTRILNWLPVPRRTNKTDCYAVRGADRWHVKRATMNHATFYVVRLNGAVIRRTELLRSARDFAEQMAAMREGA